MNLNLSDRKNVFDIRRIRSSYYGQVPSVFFMLPLGTTTLSAGFQGLSTVQGTQTKPTGEFRYLVTIECSGKVQRHMVSVPQSYFHAEKQTNKQSQQQGVTDFSQGALSLVTLSPNRVSVSCRPGLVSTILGKKFSDNF